jgi:hypothetical protein
MRADCMNSPEAEKRTRVDKDDLDLGVEPTAIPADQDIEEGDEERDERTPLPPAMPPGA